MPNFNLCSFLKLFHHWQFDFNFDGDLVLIYDSNLKLISRLTGPDQGPKSQSAVSNWNKKIISSSSSKMVVEFRSADSVEYTGFSASIQFTQLQSQIVCESWLDMSDKTLLSPNYPNSYDNNKLCQWLITISHGFHIELKFHEFDVRVLIILTAHAFSNIFYNYIAWSFTTSLNR